MAILSLIVLVIGFIWLLTSRGQITRRSGPEVGAEVMTGMGNEEVEEAIRLPTLLAMIGFFGLVVFGVLALRPVTNDVRPFNDEVLRGRRTV